MDNRGHKGTCRAMHLTEVERGRHTNTQTHKQTHKTQNTDTNTDTHRHRQTDTDRQTDRHTHKRTHLNHCLQGAAGGNDVVVLKHLVHKSLHRPVEGVALALAVEAANVVDNVGVQHLPEGLVRASQQPEEELKHFFGSDQAAVLQLHESAAHGVPEAGRKRFRMLLQQGLQVVWKVLC